MPVKADGFSCFLPVILCDPVNLCKDVGICLLYRIVRVFQAVLQTGGCFWKILYQNTAAAWRNRPPQEIKSFPILALCVCYLLCSDSYSMKASTFGWEEQPGTNSLLKKASTNSSRSLFPVVKAPIHAMFASLLRRALLAE